MDPVTVLGIAGNIVQLVDAGLKIVSKGNRIYHSANGSLAENDDLELVTNDLLVLQTKLEKSLPDHGSNPCVDEDDEALRKLTLASNEVAQTLISRLNAVKARGRFRRWNSFRQAIKSVCSKAEVDELAKRLSDFRTALQTRVLLSLNSKITESNNELRQSLKNVEHKCSTITGKFQALSDQVLSGSSNVKGDQSLLTSIHARGNTGNPSINSLLSDDYGESKVTDEDIHEAILKAFRYPKMEARHEDIKDAHAETFRWILRDPDKDDLPWDDFMQWLRGSGSIYWLKGKAASGKSTLMKFLTQQEVVVSALREWAGPSALIQAKFFFFALGTPMQKSQTGLLLSLLYQVLSQSKTLTQLVLPASWKDLSEMKRRELASLRESWKFWSPSELMDLFESVLRQSAPSSSICLFVDGLDEFLGDPSELAAFLGRCSAYENVKLCLSGRPLPSLEYELTGCPGLQLQDLTRHDIHIYVQDKLSAHRRFGELYHNNEIGAQSFIRQVVDMSSGVFLWIFLVTRSLLEGLTNFDTVQDLKQRLNDLPSELDTLYRSMLQSIAPSFYKTQASMLLQIVHLNRDVMSSLALSFANENNSALALSAAVSPISDEEANSRIDTITHRLKSRCRGLLEVQRYGHKHTTLKMVDYPLRADQVQYLHLTVREWLEQPETWKEICAWADGTGFDANMACLQGTILLIKKTIAFHGWGKHVARLLDEAMSFARQAENNQGQSCRNLIDEIDSIGCSIFPLKSLNHWSCDYTGSHQVYCQNGCCCHGSTFLEHAVRRGLVQYVRAVRHGLPKQFDATRETSLLITATCWNEESVVIRREQDHEEWYSNAARSGHVAEAILIRDVRPHPPMVKHLLDIGLDPNKKSVGLGEHSPWVEFVLSMRERTDVTPLLPSRFIDTTKLFILYGADLRSSIPSRSSEGEYKTITETLHDIFDPLPGYRTADLFDMIETRTVTSHRQEKARRSSPVDDRSLEARITKPKKKRKAAEFRSGGKRRKPSPSN